MINTRHSTIHSQHVVADVFYNSITRHHSLHAATAFNNGDVIVNFYAGSTQHFATYLTIQTGINSHITLLPDFLRFVNHSCNPNVFFDTSLMQFVCIRPIGQGDELCFFYPSTEWDMAQPFVCNCESKDCLQLVNGAAHLTKETLFKYRLTNFILEQLKQKV